MRCIKNAVALLCALALAVIGTLFGAALPAAAETAGWAEWGSLEGSAGNYTTTMQLPAGGFPEATMTSDSRGGVGIISGASTWLSADTPPGATYGSSRNEPYINLRPRADRAGAPSTTTYTFDTPTPPGGWAFVLGDIDADEVVVTAKVRTVRNCRSKNWASRMCSTTATPPGHCPAPAVTSYPGTQRRRH
jgi:hypothetical protein